MKTLALGHTCVGFTADSGLFVMVREHRISAFPNTILSKTECHVSRNSCVCVSLVS